MSGAVPEIGLRPGGRLRRRRIVNRLMESLGTLAALLAVGVLVIVVVSVVRKGAPALSWHFLVSKPNLFGGPGGGIASESRPSGSESSSRRASISSTRRPSSTRRSGGCSTTWKTTV